MIKAIIFDLDGLLIDSEGSWNEIRNQIFLDYGKPWTEVDHKAVMGVSTQEWTAYMLRRLGSDLDPQQLVEMVIDRLSALYRKEIPFLPGAKEAIRLAGKDYPLGLASGSHHSLLDIVTTHPELAGKFKVIISADDVNSGKPSPDVYLEAARRLKVSPENCLCLEDSGNGIRAGKAAGMKVVAVPDIRYSPPKGVLQMADVILKSLKEFTPALLERLSRF
ncbi:MAG: HAD family hydrolase [Anaerolineaceae bacterium]